MLLELLLREFINPVVTNECVLGTSSETLQRVGLPLISKNLHFMLIVKFTITQS